MMDGSDWEKRGLYMLYVHFKIWCKGEINCIASKKILLTAFIFIHVAIKGRNSDNLDHHSWYQGAGQNTKYILGLLSIFYQSHPSLSCLKWMIRYWFMNR